MSELSPPALAKTRISAGGACQPWKRRLLRIDFRKHASVALSHGRWSAS
jgi:hypothetical protein